MVKKKKLNGTVTHVSIGNMSIEQLRAAFGKPSFIKLFNDVINKAVNEMQ